MSSRLLLLVGAMLLGFASPTLALNNNIPATGLPSAADYSAGILPEMEGVVPWRTLAQVEPVKQGNKMVPQFSKDILGLDRKDVRIYGFIIPLDMGADQKHFLISAVPPHCPFCLPAGPDALVEVHAKKALSYGFEPIVVTGKFAVLKDDPAGVLYRMTDAVAVATPSK
jgi:hypothetical protein